VEQSLRSPEFGGYSPLEGGRGGGLVVLLLAERARSEGARSTRAFEDQPGRPLRGVERRKAQRKMRPGALLARRTRTIKLCSSDARSKGQPRPLLLRKVREIEGPHSTRAVEDNRRPPTGERVTSELGRNIYFPPAIRISHRMVSYFMLSNKRNQTWS
jgi:hypothetical protein